MKTIEYGDIPNHGQRHVIESPAKEDIRELVAVLGKSVEYFHIHCEEGTLTIGSAGIHRAEVVYQRNPYKDLTVPQGWSTGILVDEQYADSDGVVDIISGGMPDSILVYHTVTKEIAQLTAEHFLEKQAFLEGYTWLQR